MLVRQWQLVQLRITTDGRKDSYDLSPYWEFPLVWKMAPGFGCELCEHMVSSLQIKRF